MYVQHDKKVIDGTSIISALWAESLDILKNMTGFKSLSRVQTVASYMYKSTHTKNVYYSSLLSPPPCNIWKLWSLRTAMLFISTYVFDQLEGMDLSLSVLFSASAWHQNQHQHPTTWWAPKFPFFTDELKYSLMLALSWDLFMVDCHILSYLTS